MKWNFLYQITAASRTPDYGATDPRSPFCLSSTEFVEPPHPNKIPGYATGQIVLYNIWYHHTCRWPSGVQVRTGRPPTDCDDTRCCIIQFWSPDDEHNSARNM